MEMEKQRIKSGMPGLDKVIDEFRQGDNVVWQVNDYEEYRHVAKPFVQNAQAEGRNIVYIRFGFHAPIITKTRGINVYYLKVNTGFDAVCAKIYQIIKEEGEGTFYVFDGISDLRIQWFSDLMVANFFQALGPYLYEMKAVSYFAILRNTHTYDALAYIRETTQVLIDLYYIDNTYYIHPLKVAQRTSPTMYFPHRIEGDHAVTITYSGDATKLFSRFNWSHKVLGFWEASFEKARGKLSLPLEEQKETRDELLILLVGKDAKILDLCKQYFTLEDLLEIKNREIGPGYIGGKSIGMLLARKILASDPNHDFNSILEPHDSYYIGSDLFYTYIVQNGWWSLKTKQKNTEKDYFKYARALKTKILTGKFPIIVQEQFKRMLEYFGQSPIIVRSSSLLEDNFGNAFAGKYESVFCINQGTPEERYQAFAQAVRRIYASTMNEDAIAYRLNRGLTKKDEQMALLVQRVSGDFHGRNFFPHIAGVGNSSNLYVWDKNMDVKAGMLRLVLGLGTRAVDRVVGDYPRIVSLDNPSRPPLIAGGDRRIYSQHFVDILDLDQDMLTNRGTEEILDLDLKVDKSLFAEVDFEAQRQKRELGLPPGKPRHIVTLDHLLKGTDFPKVMQAMLTSISKVYDYPVDIEFTTNFMPDKSYRVNLVQCRPQQTRGLGRAVTLPTLEKNEECVLSCRGNFMGGNVRLPIDYVVYVKPKEYLALPEREKYTIARQIGEINLALKKKNAMLIGPGRWGTTTPSLGVPVRFTELCNMSVIAELAFKSGNLMPELSYGSHFFQDLVESGIFYVAIFDHPNVIFNLDHILQKRNLVKQILPNSQVKDDVIHIAETKGMQIYSDTVSQVLLCKQDHPKK